MLKQKRARANRVQLISQHLENISREALEKYEPVIRGLVRRREGIYALYRKNKLYYVGLASNLNNRLKQHLRDRHGDSWDHFSVYLMIGDHHLRELESLILRTTRPPGNKQKGKFSKSENLSRKLRNQFRLSQKKELDLLFGNDTAKHVIKRNNQKNEQLKAILGNYKNVGTQLRAEFKGTIIKAIIRADGTIRYKGQVFTSPSLAASAACNRKTANGWHFWKYERAPGDWVKLDFLRK